MARRGRWGGTALIVAGVLLVLTMPPPVARATA
ncbi:MAG: hypothetical protein QOJ85_186, partial [Solirubrobacteraceae bacterium]|nr:hypothetical protein [Solirubrobacteraceae bacterium]